MAPGKKVEPVLPVQVIVRDANTLPEIRGPTDSSYHNCNCALRASNGEYELLITAKDGTNRALGILITKPEYFGLIEARQKKDQARIRNAVQSILQDAVHQKHLSMKQLQEYTTVGAKRRVRQTTY